MTKNGHIQVTFPWTLVLGSPHPTPSPPINPTPGTQAPERWPGPCRHQRRERRAAKRSQTRAVEEVAEEVTAKNVEVSSGKSTEKVANKDTIDMHDETEEGEVSYNKSS